VSGPSLSVIICAYTLDRWDDIVAAVESVRGQRTAVAEVLLVIDHDAALAARARTELAGAAPGLAVLDSTGPRGLSGARNTGVAAARADVVAFLDDDAAAEPGWAERLLAPYADPAVVGVGGAVLPDWRAPRPRWFPSEFLWVVGCSYLGQPEGRAEVRNAIGANMSFRRSVLEAIGGFDPAVGRIGKDAGGCEETELSIRARRAVPGGRILLEPAAVCRHAVTAERTTLRYFLRRCAAEGRSKAVVTSLVGQQDALAAERRYVRSALPAGVLRGLRAAGGGRVEGILQALVILLGLAATTAAYAQMRLRLRRGRNEE
jgi:GT2 family glycosyltransferase